MIKAPKQWVKRNINLFEGRFFFHQRTIDATWSIPERHIKEGMP